MVETQFESRSIIDALKAELSQEIQVTESDEHHTMSKAHVLIKKLVNEALKGDQRMIASVLKLIEKMEEVERGEEQQKRQDDPISGSEWDVILRYYATNQTMVDKKIEDAKKRRFANFNTLTPED